MGKLIRMGTQERRLLRLRRLHWSRLLFLLGMLIIGSTYQHLRRPRGLPSPWADVSFQQPVKLASRDFPSDRVMVASRDPPEADSEMQDKMLAPQATAGRDEAATLSQTMESTPSMLRRTAKTTPTTPTQENHPSPTAAGTERIKENIPSTPGRELHHYTSSSGRQTVKSYTPAPQREVKSSSPAPARGMVKRYTPPPPAAVAHTSAPSAFVTMRTSHATASRTTVKESQTTATNKVVESSPPERTVQEATRIALKETAEHSPALLMQDVDTNILTSPRSTIKKNPVTTPRRVEKNSATDPFRLGGKKSPTPQGTVREHSLAIPEERVTVSTMTRSSPADPEASTAAWRVRNPMPRTSAPPIRTTSTTVRGLTRKASTAPGTSATPKLRADPTTQVRHCVVVESAPAVPTSSSLGLTTALLPEAPSPSTSIQPPGWPDLHSKAEYPPDLFSVEERQQGWVVLHIFGMMYVFVALAIVCDEYFVPALGVITEKLQISEDVAGATFMAAGGSAPELFTSLIGVFISHSNVGIGTIVGSAVFNILFVIGTCALFSREILNLTWWPLFRDVSFYILDLSMLILFFLDSLIAWWESLLLLLAYALYVFAMKWNKQTELWVKEQLSKRPLAKVMALGDLSKLPSMLTRGSSSASLHNSTIRSTIYQLMIHSLDPMGEARLSKEKEESLNQEARAPPQAKAESKPEEEEPAELPAVTVTPAPPPEVQGQEEEEPGSQEDVAQAENAGQTAGEEGAAPGEGETGEKSGGEAQADGEGGTEAGGSVCGGGMEAGGGGDGPGGGGEGEGEGEAQTDSEARDGDEGETGCQEANAGHQGEAKSDEKGTDGDGGGDGGDSEEEEEEEDEEEEEEEDEEEEEEEEGNEEPLSLDWPETRQKQAIYLFLLPIVFPLWLTVPDVRRQESRKFFVITFLGSIIWIAMFSYLMVWWAHQVGETIGISEEIMGLTILAAGTSIPDLITSVIVARKGLGDMAVSSSVGSNIFDITVGLPVPWLLFSLINGLQPVPVSSNGLFCAIVLLFLMLLFVISSIASCKWKMNKILGFTMFLLYFVFLIISVMLEDRIISCPVSV
ncbi:sodium/potassium/calcium exchanger 1 isoform X2 [Lepus europaeus]|uniref:sodium/potassium/calcium exchanger 1 isoform X2 n=1 Tax=Lepus europaeus TaxID=9983 RepID=UPI002B45DC9C|nr:sodium/potassium/calcium exchanger 1 isoform X2 [Lepus europaeus]